LFTFFRAGKSSRAAAEQAVTPEAVAGAVIAASMFITVVAMVSASVQ